MMFGSIIFYRVDIFLYTSTYRFGCMEVLCPMKFMRMFQYGHGFNKILPENLGGRTLPPTQNCLYTTLTFLGADSATLAGGAMARNRDAMPDIAWVGDAVGPVRSATTTVAVVFSLLISLLQAGVTLGESGRQRFPVYRFVATLIIDVFACFCLFLDKQKISFICIYKDIIPRLLGAFRVTWPMEIAQQ